MSVTPVRVRYQSFRLRVATGYDLAKRYPGLAWRCRGEDDLYRDLQAFCLFLGYPRSGHSVIGALLDAHPEIVIANELNVLAHVYMRYKRNMLFRLLLERSAQFASSGGVGGGKYPYLVPGQWQGKYEKLRVIGDKKGGGTSQHLQTHFALLDTLKNTVALPVKLIHVTRNPYDNIATIATRSNRSLLWAASYYFSLCEVINRVRDKIRSAEKSDWEIAELRYEDFLANPKEELAGLCRFLGVEAAADYLEDCASIVFEKPRRTREGVEWPLDLRVQIARQMARYPFLENYSYES